MIDTFKAYLDKTNLSENSKSAYLFALKQFTEQYNSVTKKKSYGLQDVACGQFQTADGESPLAWYELLP